MFDKIIGSILGTLLITSGLFAGKINIAVAANISYAMEDLKKEFYKLYPNTKVQIILGSSGKLAAQIKNGAPYDIFMSANMKYPNFLYKERHAVTKPLIYAQGSLSYLSGKKQNFKKGIHLIKESGIRKIAIANPKNAPYGMATIEALKNSNIYNEVKNKFVYAESISQTVSYSIMAADIGFIAKSSLYSPKMSKYKKNIHYSDVNPKLYTPINQGIVVLKRGESNSQVISFYNFVFSKKAKEVFNKFGYLTHE